MACSCCGESRELRMGVCFDCASDGERRASRRSVLAHLRRAVDHIVHREWEPARICASWAWERLTRTGDYKPGGYFAEQYGAG